MGHGCVQDIGQPRKKDYLDFLAAQAARFERVFVVTGNHEYYASDRYRSPRRHTARHDTRHTHELTRAGWAGEMHLGGFMASGKAYIESRRITHVINAAVRHTRSAPSSSLFSVLRSRPADDDGGPI